MPKVEELEYVNMRKIKSANGEMTYTIKHGAITIQMSKEKTEFICRMLASWLGFEIVKKETLQMLKNKAKKRTL